MVSKSSKQIWKTRNNHLGFENRSFRFTDEMRPLFFKWLGITTDSYFLTRVAEQAFFTISGLEAG